MNKQYFIGTAFGAFFVTDNKVRQYALNGVFLNETTPVIAGAATISEAKQTTTAQGTVATSGSSIRSEALDTATSVGGTRVNGTSVSANRADTLSAGGVVETVVHTAAATISEAADTTVATGTVAHLIGVIDNGDWRPRRTEPQPLEEAAEPVVVIGRAVITEAADQIEAHGTVRIGGRAREQEIGDQVTAAGRITGRSYRDSDNEFWLLAA